MSSNYAPMPENAARTVSDWVFVARSVVQLPDSQLQALRCMARAQLLGEEVSDWIELAAAWQNDFDDGPIAHQCLSKAESLAEQSEESELWIRLGKAWNRDFQDSDNARRCLTVAEGAATDSDTCKWIADMWVELGDYQRAVNWYRESTDNSEETSCLWTNKAEAEVLDNHDYNAALKYMARAEGVAEHSYHWTRIAKHWNDAFQASESVRRCISEAEEVADDHDDWTQIAKTWKELLEDSRNSIRCMMEAEEAADDPEHWTEILEVWKDYFKDSENYNRCLSEAHDDPDIEEFISLTSMAIDHMRSRQESASEDLGVITEANIETIGRWDRESVSSHRSGSCARNYSFTLARAAEVTIDLTSDIDSYLYLMNGDHVVLEENDDAEDDSALNSTDSRIRLTLEAGAYFVEATTYNDAEEGDFRLTIRQDVKA